MKTDKYPLCCIDFETNGIFLNEDSLAVSIRLLKPDGTPTKTEFYSLIYSDQILNPQALAVNHLTEEQVRSAPTAEQVVNLFLRWKRTHLNLPLLSPMGHNFIAFDYPRLRKLLGPEYDRIFHYHAHDSLIIAQALRNAGFLKTRSCSLDSLARYFNIFCEHPHTASGDTWTTGLVYRRLLKILNPNLITRIIRIFFPYYAGF